MIRNVLEVSRGFRKDVTRKFRKKWVWYIGVDNTLLVVRSSIIIEGFPVV